MSQPEPTPNAEATANTQRRRLLALAAAGVAGVVLAPGVRLITLAQAAHPSQGASSATRWGLLIDTTRCKTGCTACVDACVTENKLPTTRKPTDSQWIRKIEIREARTGATQSLPVMCQHCAEPPCVDVCPTGASFKRPDGIVLVDRHTCIGCRYCLMACPYKARSFVHEPLQDQKADVPRGKGTAEGCSLCVHRVDKGQSPACVEACAAAGHHAMLFGDLNNPSSAIAQRLAQLPTRQLRENLSLNTGVRYHGV